MHTNSSTSIFAACQSALEGRAVVNLQMGNTFGAFVDMNEAIKVCMYILLDVLVCSIFLRAVLYLY